MVRGYWLSSARRTAGPIFSNEDGLWMKAPAPMLSMVWIERFFVTDHNGQTPHQAVSV